jgi:hypothetical protein
MLRELDRHLEGALLVLGTANPITFMTQFQLSSSLREQESLQAYMAVLGYPACMTTSITFNVVAYYDAAKLAQVLTCSLIPEAG